MKIVLEYVMDLQNWDAIWKQISTSSNIKEEYQKAFLLNMFQKICAKMQIDASYKDSILDWFLQSDDSVSTACSIIQRTYNYEMSQSEAELMNSWFTAYRRKSNVRKAIPLRVKQDLYKKQAGKCAVCGEPLGQNWGVIHVDHIIPWVLVGDELDNNYQVLCHTCNQCKSSKTDFVFKSLMKLV